ncbi:putative nuclease HARBI1 isoform X1 [Gigantopelta aegis]|uniref:putative nuclease HARBI1 isoform X1 n=2 Tax=Gigantopelta aegis TaxID=1735272 RepID=UPI001B888AA5|nr:putative nuclease HARBI1 isoform X1 [Gigantopelta aegis]XP_041376412.1 putative nuclease HARBI1 isoform X1 [Gigantopelta aegis]
MAAGRLPRYFNERKPVLNLYNDFELVERYRFDRNSIEYITDLLAKDICPLTHRSQSVDAVTKVLVTLRYLATGKFQLCSGDDHGVSQPTVSRIVQQTLDSLTSNEIIKRFIKFPTDPNEIRRHQQRFYNVANFPGVVGIIDGTHIQIQAPTVNENEFVNRHRYHSINTQIVVDSDDRIIDVVARWPGSTHDSRILTNSGLHQLFEHHRVPVSCHLLGDSAYPCRRWILTPFLRPLPGPQTNYNRSHKKIRSCVERVIGQMKRRFHVLHGEIRLRPEKACKVTIACAVLHNICKERDLPLADDGHIQGEVPGDDGVVVNPLAAGAQYRQLFAINHFSCKHSLFM